ncbi:anti-sigma-I factor RsgI family protein [Piscibacillus sp. B03]|uniref:anti-sigma-I factor RsgI family protein n=1 Tax=Piscibacillus sp. B03 TaxID=3457430 RepID=UPI003FCE64CD
MKKGLIVEQKRRSTLFMTSDGSFYQSRKISGSVGEETTFEPLENTGILSRVMQWFQSLTFAKPAFAAIIAFLLIIPFYSWLGEEDVHAYMNIDINPSVELSLNDHYEVIDIMGLNEDGDVLINQLNDWKGEPVNQVSSNIIAVSDQLGYLEEEHQVLLGISFVSDYVNNDILQEVTHEMEASFQTIDVASFEVPIETREQAHNAKTSMNLVYASNLMDSYEEEELTETAGNEKNKNEDSSEESSHNKKNIKVIEKFVEKSKSDQIPPGLKKKVEDLQKRQRPIENASEKKSENKDKSKDPASNEGKDQRNNQSKEKSNGKGKEKDSNHPSQKDNPGKGKQGKNENRGNSKNKDSDWTPPGHEKRDKPNSGKNKDEKQKSQSNKPPGLDKKDENHPSQNKGNGDRGQGKPN